MSGIKTKETIKGTIKTLDRAAIASQKIKNSYVQTKDFAEHSVRAKESTKEEYAVNYIESYMQSGLRSTFNKANRIGYKSAQETGTKILDARREFKLNRSIKSIEKQRMDKTARSIRGDSNLTTAKLPSRYRTSDSVQVSGKGIKTSDRALKNSANAVNKANKSSTNIVRRSAKKAKDITTKLASAVKAVFTSSKTLVTAFLAGGWVILILIIIVVLFGAAFGLVSGGSTNSAYLPLSDEVLAYTETIEEYAEKYDMEDYVVIIQAVMMQESKGQGNDPMQASESEFNKKYPRIPNGITDPEYSIDVGIQTLADCFDKAEVKDVFDTDNIYLALQGYDFGAEYISWAVSNFGGYSFANAQVYSDSKKQALGVSSYGDPDYVSHVMQYVGLGFGRIRSEPNFEDMKAWGSNNPYSKSGLYGQCTWFAWGRFYEIYGYSPGFYGNGYECAIQLVNAHPDKFELSSSPKVGAIFSATGRNHVGIVIGWDGENITIQEGNLDNKTNSFQEAKTDWHTVTYTLFEFKSLNNGVVFANPK